MQKIKRYRYLGKNGILTTSILLEGNKPIYMYRLVADEGKMLTNGEKIVRQIEIFVEDVNNWTEIDAPNLTGQ
jgi:hypothetical protein